MNILVTGAAGFIGSNLCEFLLEKGHQVIGLDDLSLGQEKNIEPLKSNPQFKFVVGNICDEALMMELCAQVDAISHQAALGSVPRSIQNPLQSNKVNVEGFLTVLHCAHLNGVKRFVYAASSSSYGDKEYSPKVEDNVGNPISPYAVTKRANEMYGKVYHTLHDTETIGLRYFNVYGRRQNPEGAYAAVIPKFVQKFIQHESPVINGDGTQSRDFTYIDNVLEANYLALTTMNGAAFGEVFNIACGGFAALTPLTEKIRTLLSRFDPKIADVEITYGPKRVGDIKHSLADISKAKALLKYSGAVQIEEGLEKCINWYYEDLK